MRLATPVGLASRGILTAAEANDALYDLVDAGPDLDPKVYGRV